MLDGEVTKMSRQERRKLRNIVMFSGLGGAALGLIGYYTVGPGYAEMNNKPAQIENQRSVPLNFPSTNPFDSLGSR